MASKYVVRDVMGRVVCEVLSLNDLMAWCKLNGYIFQNRFYAYNVSYVGYIHTNTTTFYVYSVSNSREKIDKSNSFSDICEQLTDLYNRKNADYGDSFYKTFQEYGMDMVCIRLSDKLERLKKLTRGSEQKIKDESIEDTLRDMANYTIMTLMELNEKSDIPKSDNNDKTSSIVIYDIDGHHFSKVAEVDTMDDLDAWCKEHSLQLDSSPEYTLIGHFKHYNIYRGLSIVYKAYIMEV